MAADYRELVKKFRNTPINGIVTRLVPYNESHIPRLIEIRNSDRARHFLTQTQLLTVEGQTAWTKGYFSRDNDLCFMIEDPSGRIVGVNCLYEINVHPGEAEKGRQASDEVLAMAGPFSLEADLMLIRLAFEEFWLDRVVCTIRDDNEKTISMNLRMGMKRIGNQDVRGEILGLYAVDRADFSTAKFDPMFQHWRKRLDAGA